MTKAYDVLIIGGGVIGLSITYWLARRGLAAACLERRTLAGGTSSRCDGNVVLHDTHPGYECRFAKFSQDFYPELSRELDVDFHWTRKGSVLLLDNDGEVELAREHAAKMTAEGLPYRLMDRQEMIDDEPRVARDIGGGLEISCDGSLDPIALCFALAYQARKLGARILTGLTVTGLIEDGAGRVGGVRTDQGDYHAPKVVNAAGIWSPEIGRMAGLNIPVKPRQGHILVSEKTFPVARRKISEFGYMTTRQESDISHRRVDHDILAHGVAFVFEPAPHQNFLLGSSRIFTTSLKAEMAVVRAIARRAIRFFPIIKEVGAIRSYVGLRPYTADHMPIIDEPRPGFIVATGHEGSGFCQAPGTAELVSRLVSGEAAPLDMKPLKLERFGQG